MNLQSGGVAPRTSTLRASAMSWALHGIGAAFGCGRESRARTCGKASIIIVTHNNLAVTRRTLDSVLTDTDYPAFDVIVVDNGSGQEMVDELERVQRAHATVRVILNGENLGFAAANNIGIRATRDSDYIILLNNDVIVPSSWLRGLVWHLRDPNVGMVGPVTNSAGNQARVGGDCATPAEIEAFAAQRRVDFRGYIFDIPMLAMFCVAMRREVVDEVGLLDERFGLGTFEDDDYALRVRAAGYRILCAEDVFVYHVGSASFSRLKQAAFERLFMRNRALFEQKWHTTWCPPVLRTPKEMHGRYDASRRHWQAMNQPELAVVLASTYARAGLSHAARAVYHAIVPYRLRQQWWTERHLRP